MYYLSNTHSLTHISLKPTATFHMDNHINSQIQTHCPKLDIYCILTLKSCADVNICKCRNRHTHTLHTVRFICWLLLFFLSHSLNANPNTQGYIFSKLHTHRAGYSSIHLSLRRDEKCLTHTHSSSDETKVSAVTSYCFKKEFVCLKSLCCSAFTSCRPYGNGSCLAF